jgi:hypothetical protein
MNREEGIGLKADRAAVIRESLQVREEVFDGIGNLMPVLMIDTALRMNRVAGFLHSFLLNIPLTHSHTETSTTIVAMKRKVVKAMRSGPRVTMRAERTMALLRGISAYLRFLNDHRASIVRAEQDVIEVRSLTRLLIGQLPPHGAIDAFNS